MGKITFSALKPALLPKPTHILPSKAPSPVAAVISDNPKLPFFKISPAMVGWISSIPRTKKPFIKTKNKHLKIISLLIATFPPSIKRAKNFLFSVTDFCRLFNLIKSKIGINGI